MKKKINQDETELPFYLQNGYIDWRKEYREKCNLLDEDYKEVDCQQFYRDIFPPEIIESCWEDHRPNPVLTYCKYLKKNDSPGSKSKLAWKTKLNRKAASYEHVGRPKGAGKQEIIWEWRRNHPEGSKADCIRETGLSKPTVYKWWNQPATAKNLPFVGFAIRSFLQSGSTQRQRMYQYYILLQRKAS